MSEISDELRRLTNSASVRGHTFVALQDIADRIDKELVELPRDKDGVPINVGDKVYLDDGRKAEVVRITLMPTQTKYCLICRVYEKNVWYLPSDISHKRPDSWERIADELDEMVDAASHADDTCEKLSDLAGRIRKLAATDGERS